MRDEGIGNLIRWKGLRSKRIEELKVIMGKWATQLTDKLDSLDPSLRKQLYYEIGDWPQYMRLLHQVGKKWVDKYLGYDHPIGQPYIFNFPQ